MISEIKQTVQTTQSAAFGSDLVVDDIRSDVRVKIPAGHRVEIELLGKTIEVETRPLHPDGGVDWKNPHRETVSVCWWSGDAGAIPSAVVQYIARKHDSLTSTYSSEAEKVEAAALLHRIAGAMGVNLPQPVATGADA